jgi:hypothetical protein
VKLETVISQEQAEELMQWHTESTLIESRKGHHVSFRRRGERRGYRHLTGLELHHRHKPMLHGFLHVAWCNSGRGPVLLRHGSMRKEGQHLQDPSIAYYFPFLSSFSPFFRPSFLFGPDTRKEVRRER